MYSAHFILGDSGLSALFSALGIEWRSLILNGIAFLVVVWILGKYVYPILTKALDNKQNELTAATRLEGEAKEIVEQARLDATEIIVEARSAADEIVATAKDDVAQLLKSSRDQAEAQAERITTEAREQLARDVTAARSALRAETAQLIASATETILGEKLDSAKDTELIRRMVEAKR